MFHLMKQEQGLRLSCGAYNIMLYANYSLIAISAKILES